jgi:hypothetical protein
MSNGILSGRTGVSMTAVQCLCAVVGKCPGKRRISLVQALLPSTVATHFGKAACNKVAILDFGSQVCSSSESSGG